MAFNIRKATGRGLDEDKAADVTKASSAAISTLHPDGLKTPSLGDSLNDEFDLFESLVTHNYLTRLSDCPIVAPVPKELSGMGWYRITKIVLDEEVFFPDQLSMLYTALHNVASNVALVIDKKAPDDIEIYIGARDFSGDLYNASNLLKNAIQGYLPGVQVENTSELQFVYPDDTKYVASYSGIASFRDGKREDFVQGIERFIDSTPAIPKFTAFFIADNVSQEQALNMINAFSSIEDALTPLVQSQETVSESDTEGVSKTITETIGKTISETLSETVTRTEGTNVSFGKSRGVTTNSGTTRSPNIIDSLCSKIFGGNLGSNTGTGTSDQDSEQHGSHLDTAKANQKSKSNADNKQHAEAYATNSSKTTGTSHQITRTNTRAKRYVDILSRHIERIQNGMPFGLWSIGTYFVSLDQSTSLKLANIYKGCITGEESDIVATAVNVWNEGDSTTILNYIREIRNPRFLVGNVNVSPGVLTTSKELAIHMSLPQSSIPGVEVRESVTFGRNLNRKLLKESRYNRDNFISIGKLTHLGNVSQQEVLLSLEELSKHVFVTGSTGSGKSNTTYLLVKDLLSKGKKILVIEPTKGDYRKVFGGREDITVYGTRPNEKNILRINPFAFPDGLRVDEHVERLVEIFGVCWPMYAAMPAVLKDSIFAAYKACGWNLLTSTCKYGRLFPTIKDVIVQLKKIISSSAYSADTKGDYVGALQTRLMSLTNGIYASILTSDAISYEQLFDENAIIDLHRIGSSETRSLLMGLLVLALTEWRSSNGEDSMDEELKHVTVLEEAHCILPRVSKQQSQESSNVVGKSVEMIASSIAEMRSYGQGFIIVDQSPSAVDEAAIRNTNTKIIMNLPDGDDREIAGKSMGLTKDLQIAELAKLPSGEAIVFQRGWNETLMTRIHFLSKTEYSPLSNISKQIDEKLLSVDKPSDLFIRKFVTKSSKVLRSKLIDLKEEILSAKCDSLSKAALLDALDAPNSDESKVAEAVLDYLGLKSFTSELLDNATVGTPALIHEIRNYLASMEINDTKVQNILLSMTFIWAASINQRWHTICSQSMPKNK